MNLAALCGLEIEVLAERDEWSQSFATPDGQVRLESAVEPQRAVDESGVWAPIDTTLTLGADGVVRPVNTVRDMAFSAGGAAPLVSMEFGAGESMVLDWPGVLPEPELDGPAARYAEVLPGVDLIVEATPVGFRHDLVVNSAEAAASSELEAIEFDLAAIGLSVEQTEDRVVSVLDGAGVEVTGTVPPTMWDSPSADGRAQALTLDAMSAEETPEGAPAQRIAEVGVELDDQTLTLVPDLELLRGAETSYPVVIDPQWKGGIRDNDWGMAIARSDTRSSSFYRGLNNSGNHFLSNVSVDGDAGAGYTCERWSGLTCSSERYQIQSFFRMNTQYVSRSGDRIPTSASFKILQRHSADCNNGLARVHRTALYTASATWNTRPVSRGQASTTSSADHGAGCGGPEYVSFNVSDMVESADANDWYSITVGMWRWELDPSTDLRHWNRFDSSTAVLEIQYMYRAGLPQDRRTEGRACKEYPDFEWVTTERPMLSAVPNAPSSASGTGVEFRVYRPYSGGELLKAWKVPGNPGSTVTTSIPAGVIPSDGLFRWSARTYVDGNQSATREPLCYFEVDTSAPEPPDIVQVTERPELGDPVTFEIVGAGGVTEIQYRLEGQSTSTVPATGGRATVTVTPSSGSIDHVLQAWAIDAAGNDSSRTDAAFTTAKTLVPEAVGAWRLNGSGRDDAAGNQLSDDQNLAFTTDPAGREAAALNLDGTSDCARTEDPVVDTTNSFTVAAWVKPVSGSNEWPKVMSQAGSVKGSFYFEWSQSADRWTFTLTESDVSGTPFAQVTSSMSPRIGQWQHIAGVFDAAANRIRFYVDGVLQGTDTVGFEPWQSTGPLSVGCAVRTTGVEFGFFGGGIDDAAVFQDAMTSDQVSDLADGTGLPAGEAALWPLRAPTETEDPNTGLTIPDDAVWTEDAFGRQDSAIDLPGTAGQCLTAGAPVRSDAPFTASAWVRLDGENGHQHPRVFSFRGEAAFAVMLKYETENAYWTVAARDSDSSEAEWDGVSSTEPAVLGAWTHLAVTVNPDADTIALYVDGVVAAEQGLSLDPWRSSEFTIGCGGTVEQEGTSLWDGAISDVRLWHGIASPEQIWDLGLDERSYWELTQSLGGTDSWGTSDLSLEGTHEWVVDRFENCEAAYGLDLGGQAWAQTTSGSPVVTDASFTVSAWVKLDNLEEHQAVVTQSRGVDDTRAAFYLKYHPTIAEGEGRWLFTMPGSTSGDSSWHDTVSTATPQAGKWTHLTAVWDQGAGELRLYVDGELQGSTRGPEHPWHFVDGETLIGASGDEEGGRWSFLSGAVDQVQVYGGVADRDWIEVLSANRPKSPVPPTDCDW